MSLLKSLFDKPWEYQGENPALKGHELAEGLPPQKIALYAFLCVVFVLFGLFVTAYFVRMELDDWRPLQEPGMLWLNTFILFLCSVAMQWTRGLVTKDQRDKVKIGMVVSGILTVGFIYGQLIAWEELNNAGFYLASNPANSFFYVLTGIHALHMLGGLLVWISSTVKVWSGTEVKAVKLSVELCAVYWHFLLLVWLILFALLSYT